MKMQPFFIQETQPRQGMVSGLNWAILIIWLLILFTFTLPGRSVPSSLGGLDLVAIVKLGARMLGFAAFTFIVVHSWHSPLRPLLVKCFFPLSLYTAWSVFSTLWSPLQAISIGQASGLLVQVQLAFVIALYCSSSKDYSRILYHLNLAMLFYSSAVLVVALISYDASGLNRELNPRGFIDPTAAGATASLGLVAILSVRFIWNWQWSRLLLIPSVLIHSIMLAMAYSRTAIAVGLFCVLLVLMFFTQRIIITLAITLFCTVAAGYILMDPHLDSIAIVNELVSEGAQRGETSEQMQSFNGRTQLWEQIWISIKEAPMKGHGYFMTSATGYNDVWSDYKSPVTLTAHNVFLQVLVSTGLIGFILFLWGIGKPLLMFTGAQFSKPGKRKMGAFMTIISTWYLTWGMLCSSFMGPVRVESIFFFTILGLAVGSIVSYRQTGGHGNI
ncbi:MAG: O-antigen ligase family protein [Desulfobacterales bacterium]|nr:O-antigen ligase family protein [Desulfobacterales bacterium]